MPWPVQTNAPAIDHILTSKRQSSSFTMESLRPTSNNPPGNFRTPKAKAPRAVVSAYNNPSSNNGHQHNFDESQDVSPTSNNPTPPDFKTPKAKSAPYAEVSAYNNCFSNNGSPHNLNASQEASLVQSRNETIPTAHVFPSPAFPASSTAPTSTNHVTFSNVTTPSSPSSHHWNTHKSTSNPGLLPPSSKSGNAGDFQALIEDPDMTFANAQLSGYHEHERDPVIEHCGRYPRPGSRPLMNTYSGVNDSHHNFQTLQPYTTSLYDHSPNHQHLHQSSTAAYSLSSSAGAGGLGGGGGGAGYQSLTSTYRPGDYSSAGLGGAGLGGMHDELSQWQQRHQEQLRRQQNGSDYPQTLRMSDNGRAGFPGTGDPMLDPRRLDSIKQAADNIIKEKDHIIDRQKLTIMQLERQGKASQAEITRDVLRKAQSDLDAAQLRIQEAEYQKASLKAQLQEARANNDRDLLERKLGETEYAMQQLKTATEQEISTKITEIRQLQDKVEEKDESMLSWKDRHTELQQTCDTLTAKVASLERYLMDLPTHDEKTRKQQEVKSLKDEGHKYRSQVAELEKLLKEAVKGIKSRDALIASLEEHSKQMKDNMDTLQSENSSLSIEVSRLKGEGPESEDDIEELKRRNTRLQNDLDKAKKLLESQQKRSQQQESRHRGDRATMEDRLTQEEANVQAMRTEINAKDQHLRKLRASVKELGGRNQELMEKSLGLQDRVREYERSQQGDEGRKLERRLRGELSACFSELQGLVNVCVQRAEGQDPNMSALLGVKASASATDVDPGSEDQLQSLKYRVTKVREMREDVDKLRELISNKYAEDMGANLDCTTQ